MKDSFFSSLLLESLLLFGKKKTERRLGEWEEETCYVFSC
jgi:hypothetical protein